jgi:heat shock protein HslJ
MNVRRLGALVAVALLAAGCSSAAGSANDTADGSGGELGATQWVLRSYDSAGALALVPDDQYADAEFTNGFTSGHVAGFAGCNEYSALYRAGGRLLFVSMFTTTRVSCGETADAFERTYLNLLSQSRFYNVNVVGDTLTIRGATGTVLLVFDAAPANPLLGSWVVDSYSTAPGALVAPLPGTELTAVFRLAKVGGSSGCNTYQGPYTTNGTVAAIGPLATTQMACAEDVTAQETSFLAALQGVARVEVRAQTVQLEDRNGGIVVALRRPVEVVASPSPSAQASPTASRSPSPSPSASPSPTATPTAKPTATHRSADPEPEPDASKSPATIVPPASLPPVANCALIVPTDVTIATIVYPATWHTTTTPPAIACRYFDPAPITVPADPATLSTAVMITTDLAVPYQDALTSATNPTAWNVLTNEPVTVSGLPAARIQATATAGSPGFAIGVTRYGYLIDLGTGSSWIETKGTVGDPTYVTNQSAVDLIASQSTITPPAP